MLLLRSLSRFVVLSSLGVGCGGGSPSSTISGDATDDTQGEDSTVSEDGSASASASTSDSVTEATTDSDSATDSDTATDTTSDSGSTTGGGTEPIECDDALEVQYAPNGLPLIQSNPGAPIALYLDFDGGIYHSSSDGDVPYVGYSRDTDFDTFNAQEQSDIIRSFTFVSRYFAMFDVNVTTDDAVRVATGKWGWILISEEASGGSASTSSAAIGTEPYARAYAGSSTVEPDNQDKSRRLAHELGHNFQLEHSGVWDNGTFYKWEDWPQWDGVYGPIMGGGGEGQRNGWSYGQHAGSMSTMQDTMQIIRQRIIDVGGRGDGWREDDFDAFEASPMCIGQDELYREAILVNPADEDRFTFEWAGGDLNLQVQIPEVSAALIDVQLMRQGDLVRGAGTYPGLEAGTYELLVRSQGGYGEIGAYRVSVH